MENYKKRALKKARKYIIYYVLLVALGLIFIYPFLFLISGSFKSNAELATSTSLIPTQFSVESYVKGWEGVGQYTFGLFIVNSIKIVVPVVIFTIISSSIVAYGFARFKFRGRNLLFMLMISTLMLPNTVTVIPRYMIFRQFRWLNTYLPFWVPAALACSPFFIYSMMQFIRGIPREIDESAFMDGCTTFQIFTKIIMPLSKPAIFSVGIFQFIWTWNDYFNPLIFINSVKKYNVMQGLRLSMDSTTGFSWGPVLAMSFVSMIPCIIVFFTAQQYFVEGISTTGLKG
jgi:oligogalacturonide transport system permease protein